MCGYSLPHERTTRRPRNSRYVEETATARGGTAGSLQIRSMIPPKQYRSKKFSSLQELATPVFEDTRPVRTAVGVLTSILKNCEGRYGGCPISRAPFAREVGSPSSTFWKGLKGITRLVRRSGRRIAQGNQSPRRILSLCQRCFRIRINNRQHGPTAYAANRQALTLHRQHPVFFAKNPPPCVGHRSVRCTIQAAGSVTFSHQPINW